MFKLVDTLILVLGATVAMQARRRSDRADLPWTVVFCLPLLLAVACARGGWVETYPDLAEEARLQPERLVVDALEQTAGVHGFVGSYRLEASRGAGSRSIDVYVMAELPDRLSIELLAPTGQSEAFLKSGAREVSLWIGEENRLYRGPAAGGAFAAALGLDLSVEDVISVLLGRLPGWNGIESGQVAWDEKEQRIRVSVDASTSGWLHPVTLRFDRMRFLGRGADTDVQLREWTNAPAVLPRIVELEVPDEGLKLHLRLARAWLADPDLVATDFEVPVLPANTVQLTLEVLAAEGGLLRRGLER
jgi:hypothetical protein